MAAKDQKLKNTLDGIEKELGQRPPRIPIFQAYDPYITYSFNDGFFKTRRGDSLRKDDDGRVIFKFGETVFKELCEGISRDDFIDLVNGYQIQVKSLGELYKQRMAEGKLIIASHGDDFEIDMDSLDETQVLGIAWQHLKTINNGIDEDIGSLFREMYLISALISIDDILISKDLGMPVISQTMCAMESFNNALALGSQNEYFKKARKKLAYEAALARLKKDPKEAAMQKIEKEHEALKPHQKTDGYLAPFARAMQAKYSSVLNSPVAIERRIRKLKNSKQAK